MITVIAADTSIKTNQPSAYIDVSSAIPLIPKTIPVKNSQRPYGDTFLDLKPRMRIEARTATKNIAPKMPVCAHQFRRSSWALDKGTPIT